MFLTKVVKIMMIGVHVMKLRDKNRRNVKSWHAIVSPFVGVFVVHVDKSRTTALHIDFQRVMFNTSRSLRTSLWIKRLLVAQSFNIDLSKIRNIFVIWVFLKKTVLS